MDFSHLLAGGALVGLISSFWGKIKEFAWRALCLVIQRVEFTEGRIESVVLQHLLENYKHSKTYDKIYSNIYEVHRLSNDPNDLDSLCLATSTF